jgi:repressor LexA
MVRTRKGLTARHQRVLNFIQEYLEKNGYPPSIREIGEATGISSTSVVTYYLKQLEELGLIRREQNVSRAILPVRDNVSFLHIPVVGRIFASEPVPVPPSDFNYYDAESSVTIARSLLPARERNSELFALEVQGDSMIDAMIGDGDLVIMKKVERPSNGDMVAVWLKDRNETTLKYFYDEGKRIRLQPANPTMAPIYVDKTDNVHVQGKVIMVIRKLDRTN